MCDEYDDERMRAIWWLLEERQKLVMFEPEPAEAEEPIVRPVILSGETAKPKLRALVR